MKNKTRKVLVVCAEVSEAAKTRPDCGGWLVVWAPDAKVAIARARRERFDLAVLISTGQEMDITETLFNLRDIRQSLPIAVVEHSSDRDDDLSRVAALPTDTNVIAVHDLGDLVRLLQPHDPAVVNQSSGNLRNSKGEAL